MNNAVSKIGQRWRYNNQNYIWIVEIIAYKKSDHAYDQCKIVQIITQPKDDNSVWRIGSTTGIDYNTIEWTYLNGQEAINE